MPEGEYSRQPQRFSRRDFPAGDGAFLSALHMSVEIAIGKIVNEQPAERISTVPSMKMATICDAGCPSAAIHTPHSVGHSNSRMPMGRFRRVSLK